MAELACAVKSVHDLSYIHRDIKPDNILISRSGHLKLTDFGLCKQMAEDADKQLWEDCKEVIEEVEKSGDKAKQYKHRKTQSCVGTPDYVAPEVVKRVYGRECDWWSVGVILFECIVGYPPFMADSLQETIHKILKYKKYLKIPDTVGRSKRTLSRNAKSVINAFLCDAKDRITFNGIMKHPFFACVDWKNLQDYVPPFVPEVKDESDTSNFDFFKEDKSVRHGLSVKGDTARLNFPDFTWNKPTPAQSKRHNAFDIFSSENQENQENNPNQVPLSRK
eukprot:CAMPEP_0114525468 /NCGR_PEP_ID=MMETSP0109-20121206/22442_1 /TAXON_ID=29199 /ORGANISM="Chlorarachnion reptans, Strain CCCM449" /LENGTH=277 /DNA_ID=CAMNT_0001707055 /DNA_START=63 /DNA_END=896 /DNA_ORIENTATION=-